MLTPLPGLTDAGIMVEEHNSYCFGIELDKNASGEIYCHLGSTFGRESYFIRSQHETLLLQYYPTLKITMYLRLPLNYLMA
ncbi:hypothetical protein IAE49_10345 [Kosakonia sp. S58]|uniref:hypothetical protein n=1 Tax=unclassified Kosakonia TaxID=2632876 RepID=UPI001907E904|nr:MULTISPECIES: hypothetical protein [unclassified Kosakonia]MBK0079848.1 hypothetical protein [Kosakonia sp. S57]MBK0086642.1 hypothetical protein [Kosakonia sp. S58]